MSVSILTGHLGSGKTEVAINLAVQMSGEVTPVTLVDIDVINPYFAAREARQFLERHGVRLAAPSQKTISADIPALPKEIFQHVHQNGNHVILDVGGDPAGAIILRSLRRHLEDQETTVFCVVNVKRPSTSTREGTLSYIEEIGDASGLGISALIHNTHLLHETSAQDIYEGQRLLEEVARESGIPILYTTIMRRLAPQLTQDIKNDVLMMERYLLPPYADHELPDSGF